MPHIPLIIPTPITAVKSYLQDVGRFQYTNGPLFAALLSPLHSFFAKWIPGLINYLFYKGSLDMIQKEENDVDKIQIN